MVEKKSLSIIVPLYNEEDALPHFAPHLISSISKLSEYEREIVFVDDGSSDRTFEILQEICAENSVCKTIQLRKHFGKTAALMAAFKHISGKYVITIDGDGQDDPDEIPRILEGLDQGYDLVNCWKQNRKDIPVKRVLSKIFNSVISFTFGVNLRDHNCGFKGYRREVIDELDLYGEMHRFIPVIAGTQGFSFTEIPVVHHQREHGSSKYGFERVWRGFFDMTALLFLYNFSTKPLHFFGFFGVLFLSFGFLIGGYFYVDWLATGASHIRPMMLLGLILIILGFQSFSLGFICELLTAKNHEHEYRVREKVNFD